MNIKQNVFKSTKSILLSFITISIILFTANLAMAKHTIIMLNPTIDAGAQQDMYKSESINRYDAEKITSTLAMNLKQALIKTNKFNVKLMRNSKLEGQIRRELAATDSQSADDSFSYLMSHKARFLVQVSLTAVDAGRIVNKLSDNVYNYKDSGSISINLSIVDTGDTQSEGQNAGNQVYSESIEVTYRTPYRRLRSGDRRHVNSRFWNEIIKKASRKMVSKIINKQERLYVLSSNSSNKIIKLNQGKVTGNLNMNDQLSVQDTEGNSVAVIMITSLTDNSATAKVLSTKGEIKNGYLVTKLVKQNTNNGDLF